MTCDGCVGVRAQVSGWFEQWRYVYVFTGLSFRRSHASDRGILWDRGDPCRSLPS